MEGSGSNRESTNAPPAPSDRQVSIVVFHTEVGHGPEQVRELELWLNIRSSLKVSRRCGNPTHVICTCHSIQIYKRMSAHSCAQDSHSSGGQMMQLTITPSEDRDMAIYKLDPVWPCSPRGCVFGFTMHSSYFAVISWRVLLHTALIH